MENLFLNNKKHNEFEWNFLDNIEEGRGSLGTDMPVKIYRLMQYTMLDILSKEHGITKANEYFKKAGHLAGSEFSKNMLDLNQNFNGFLSQLQEIFCKLKIGILRLELSDFDKNEYVLTVSEDLDCSGLPITNEVVCNYDEGFIAGIFETYTGKIFDVKEVDCWATGNRICRFKATLI